MVVDTLERPKQLAEFDSAEAERADGDEELRAEGGEGHAHMQDGGTRSGLSEGNGKHAT